MVYGSTRLVGWRIFFQSEVSLVSVWSVTDSILLRHGDVRPVDGGASPRSSSSTQYYGVSCAHLSKTVENRPWMHVEITSIWNLRMTKNRWKFAILSVFNKWFNRYIHSGPKWWKIVHQCPLKSRQCKASEWPKNRSKFVNLTVFIKQCHRYILNIAVFPAFWQNSVCDLLGSCNLMCCVCSSPSFRCWPSS